MIESAPHPESTAARSRECLQQDLLRAKADLAILVHNVRECTAPRLRSLRLALTRIPDPAARLQRAEQEAAEACEQPAAAAQAARRRADDARTAFDSARKDTRIHDRAYLEDLRNKTAAVGASTPEIEDRMQRFSAALAELDRATSLLDDADAALRTIREQAHSRIDKVRRACQDEQTRRTEIQQEIAAIGDPETPVHELRGRIRDLEAKIAAA